MEADLHEVLESWCINQAFFQCQMLCFSELSITQKTSVFIFTRSESNLYNTLMKVRKCEEVSMISATVYKKNKIKERQKA